MVLEYFDNRTFFDWLLGTGWQLGAVSWLLPLGIGLVIALLLVGWLSTSLRKEPLQNSRIPAGVLIGALAVFIPSAALLLAGWIWRLGFLRRLLGDHWYEGSLYLWVLIIVGVGFVAFLICWLCMALRRGPLTGLRAIWRGLSDGAMDLAHANPNRILALSWLAVREAIRRRVVVVFALFILLLLFAGWFLDPGSPQPARLYLSFVLIATTYLMLLLALILSTLSLPEDIKRKTIYTVVTKPVRPCEIVLGRIFGFSAVGTVLLVIMGSISYAFVVRGLSHTHELIEADLEVIKKDGKETLFRKGTTSTVGNHWHAVEVDDKGRVRVNFEQGHWHEATSRKAGAEKEFPLEAHFAEQLDAEEVSAGLLEAFDEQGVKLDPESTEVKVLENGKRWEVADADSGDLFTVQLAEPEAEQSPQLLATKRVERIYSVGPPRGILVARVPIYGDLRFKNRAGKDVPKGVNVGDEWSYRSFIQGGTLATAIWTFKGITKDKFPKEEFPQGIPLEMTIEVFRTYKGDTDDPKDIPGIPGSLSLRNPETNLRVDAVFFTAKDFVTDVQYLPFTLRVDKKPEELDKSREKIFRKLDNDASGDLTVEEFAGTRNAGGEELAERFRVIDKDGDETLSLVEFVDPTRQVDLFEDLIADGKMEVWLRCLHPSQFFGAAQADAYVRAHDRSFAMNFVKGYVGIWLQLLVITTIGVMFSTFLSGPVATIAALGSFVGGLCAHFMASLGASLFMSDNTLKSLGLEKVWGGGPFESLIRLLTQQNVVSEMERSLRTDISQMVDGVLGYVLFVMSYVLPRFYLHSDSRFNVCNSVANGFNVSGDTMSICLCRTLAYMVPVFAAAFLFLKTREVAK